MKVFKIQKYRPVSRLERMRARNRIENRVLRDNNACWPRERKRWSCAKEHALMSILYARNEETNRRRSIFRIFQRLPLPPSSVFLYLFLCCRVEMFGLFLLREMLVARFTSLLILHGDVNALTPVVFLFESRIRVSDGFICFRNVQYDSR